MSFKDLYMVKIKNFSSTTPFLLHFFKLKAAGQPATYLVDQSQNPKQPDYKRQHRSSSSIHYSALFNDQKAIDNRKCI